MRSDGALLVADEDGGDGVLHRLQGTADHQLVSGLDAPHGLAFDLDEDVLVTDLGGGGRLIKVFVH